MYAELITWLTKNAEAILVGVVASLLVLFGQSTVRTVSLAIAILITRRWHLRLLWRFGAPQHVVVVSGAVEGVTDVVRSAILAGPDAHAANIMLSATEDLYPKCEVRHVYSSSFPPELYKEDLIVVGGPINNSCTAAILRRLHGQLDFRNDFELHVGGAYSRQHTTTMTSPYEITAP